MWVSDRSHWDEKLFAYSLSDKQRDADKDVDTLRSFFNTHPQGIWSNQTTVWVADSYDDKLYAYNLETKQRDPAEDFDTLGAANNLGLSGIWSDSTTMWVSDWVDDKIYAYNRLTKQRDAEKDFDTLNAADNTFPRGIWSDRTTMWVADRSDDKIYAYNVVTKRREPEKDFDTLAESNFSPEGIWSDGITMWVAQGAVRGEGGKIYAYNMATKQRDLTKEFDTLQTTGNAFPFPEGIWSDGSTLWVADWHDDKLYAYNMPLAEPEVPVTVRRTTTTTTGGSPEIDETDPARPSAVSAHCVSAVVDPDGGDIELGDIIADSWVSGLPLRHPRRPAGQVLHLQPAHHHLRRDRP